MRSTTPEDGWANLKHPELYADLQAAGSLAAALEQTAAELQLDVGEIRPGSWGRLLSAHIGAAPELHRRPLEITSAANTRSFAFSGWSRGARLIDGWTADLRELARSAALWRSGATLTDIQRACPWTRASDLALAHERGPADAVTVMWELVRAQMHEPIDDQPFELGIRAADAAYAEPRLRELFPYTSHWVLCFSRCTGSPHTFDVPCIGYLLPEWRYQVRWPGWEDIDRLVLGEADTAEEAVALVVANLPEGCSAAVAGTRDDL
ncbi:hypothetical protein KDK95_23260 [Actinospica sp. MGRD01-02]|uniref:Uncharacterized protein n=1 Tax=Actinospica acidithermotolerans TaxID=2828514 RepID=A0A941ED03_9ACTN|nr:DUF6193 family natural product biosynthesis protein [Actinospica acidithermotolerans]MBR7829246.1 hypothetical protein [Actinospica acidithermotolerans]